MIIVYPTTNQISWRSSKPTHPIIFSIIYKALSFKEITKHLAQMTNIHLNVKKEEEQWMIWYDVIMLTCSQAVHRRPGQCNNRNTGEILLDNQQIMMFVLHASCIQKLRIQIYDFVGGKLHMYMWRIHILPKAMIRRGTSSACSITIPDHLFG